MVCEYEPSSAQSRCLAHLLSEAELFLSRASLWSPSGDAIRLHVRLDQTSYADRHGVAVPLGISAGVPDLAATCDVAGVFAEEDDPLAGPAADPAEALLPVDEGQAGAGRTAIRTTHTGSCLTLPLLSGSWRRRPQLNTSTLRERLPMEEHSRSRRRGTSSDGGLRRASSATTLWMCGECLLRCSRTCRSSRGSLFGLVSGRP